MPPVLGGRGGAVMHRKRERYEAGWTTVTISLVVLSTVLMFAGIGIAADLQRPWLGLVVASVGPVMGAVIGAALVLGNRDAQRDVVVTEDDAPDGYRRGR